MVKCEDCGFLALRAVHTGALVEAHENFRRMGDANIHPLVPEAFAFSLPVCFAQKLDFIDAIGQAGGRRVGNPRPGDVLLALRQDRDCDGFTPWRLGWTPREHQERIDHEAAQLRDEEFRREVWGREDSRDADTRSREDARDADMRRREDRRDEEARGRHKSEIVAFGFVVSLATLIGAVLGGILDGAVSRGWQPGWWPFS